MATAALLGGCGNGDSGRDGEPQAGPVALTAAERRQIEGYDARIAAHCVRVSRGLVDPAAGPTTRQTHAAFAAARQLLALAAQKPDAPLGAGQDLRLFVSDVLENLEGSNCDPRMRALLARGLARIPQP